MRDDLMGGVLAMAVAAPVVIVCRGGGGVVLAGLSGAIGGWLDGLGGADRRSLRRRTGDDACCIDAADAMEPVYGQS